MCVNKAKNLTIIITTKTIIPYRWEKSARSLAAAASRWQLFSGAAGAGGLQHVQHTKRDKTHTSPIDIIIKPPGISLLYVKRRRLINWIIVSFHSPSPRPSDDSWCWLQAEKVVIFRGRWLIAMAFIVDYYISAPWTLPRVVASYHPTSPPPSLVKCMLTCCFTLWCESRLCDRGVVRLMCCARRSRSRSLFHSYSLASFWCNFIFRVFYILTGTFFSSLSYNLITWCPASFRPSTHLAAWRLGHTQSLLVLNRLTLCSGGGRWHKRASCMCFEFLWFYYPLF